MKRYFTIANLLLLALIAYLGVEVLYRIATAPLEGGAVLEASPHLDAGAARQSSQPFSHYRPIIERNLFRTKKEALADGGAPDIGNLQQTELRLKLLGTVTGDKHSAYAVIEDEKERQQNLYRTGASVQSATLKMILREKVILSVDGRDEVLEIEKPQSSSGVQRQTASRTRQGRASRTTRTAPTTQRVNLKRSVLEDATGNIEKLMKDVSIRPHFVNGKPGGLRLSRVQSDSIFRKMGLRRGDIITGVDGQSIESVDDAIGLYSRLKSADNVKVEITRMGKPRILDYNIQ